MVLLACHVLIVSISSTCNPNITCNLNVTLLHYANFQLNPVQSIEWSNHCDSQPSGLVVFHGQILSPWVCSSLPPKKMIILPFQPVSCYLSFVITLPYFPDFWSSWWLLTPLNPSHFYLCPLLKPSCICITLFHLWHDFFFCKLTHIIT